MSPIEGSVAGRKHTDEQVLARLAAVEAVMMAGEYNRASSNGLAERFDVSLRQVQRDAAQIREAWRLEAEEGSREGDRTDWIKRVRGAQARSWRNGHSMAAARLLQLEGQALGVYEPQKREVTHHSGDDPASLANELRDALPLIHDVLGLPPPEPLALETTYEEVPNGTTQEEG